MGGAETAVRVADLTALVAARVGLGAALARLLARLPLLSLLTFLTLLLTRLALLTGLTLLTLTVLRLGPALKQERDFGLPAHQRREPAPHRDATVG